MSALSIRFGKLSVLMAAYNEEGTLVRCIERIMSVPLPAGMEREVVLVDDGSKDSTWLLAQELATRFPAMRVFQQPKNQGKGAALRRAIKEMTGDVAVFQDADMEYDPFDYTRMLKPILDGRADVVFGSRFTGEERKVLLFWHSLGNCGLTLLSNMLNDINLTDMETCYKMFVADKLRMIPLESNRFGIEPEVTAKIARLRLRIYEVPISYDGRTYAEGKKINWKDGFAALWFLFKYRFSSNYALPDKVALDALEQAPRFNQWMYDMIAPYLGERLVELGSGRGNISRLLRGHGHILLTDYQNNYLDELNERWGHLPTVKVAKLNLSRMQDFSAIQEYKPDTVVCLNVLEHIEKDQAVLDRLQEVLPTGCRLVFLVPYNQALFSEFDRQIGHYRRYQKGELEDKMGQAGFEVERQFFFNKAGVLAWYAANTLGKQRTITPAQTKIYNLLTPLFRIMEPILPMAGLSTIVVARKKTA